MHRKVVTVLFCDVVGSTALGESSDPETLRAVLAHYFDRMKSIVEGHGGSVEKFIDEAWALANDATTRLRDRIGDDGEWALAHIARFQGDHEAAVRYLRRYCAYLEAHHAHSYLSTSGPRLARELWAIGRAEEGEPLAQLGRSIGDKDDFATQMTWRQAQALLEATRGAYNEAERLAREAVAIGEKTDALNNLGDAYLDLAEVLRASGRLGEARVAAEHALGRYERKRNLAMAAQARAKLAEMEAPNSIASA